MKAKGLGILSALTASICCLGPLLLIVLGLGSLGLGAVLGRYHGYFILGAALLLAFAWRRYFKEKNSCESARCEMEGKKLTRDVLVSASAVVLLFTGLNLYTYVKGSVAGEVSKQGTQVSIPVEGMSCFTCEIAVQSAVKKLSGVYRVKASAKDKIAIVSYNPQRTNLDWIVAAINETGYKAKKPQI
ncbi:MAG: heavy-metal-associated domain-containing protein [Candidatus Omnitrophica bacterium]|nr:heavy-metal-associated domain-containing protein [Candidatus Omnitrophota bacterium]